ncbi:hypothetical protein SYNTR_2086 [Candidatus Syntrophocurvum alkaliphilum]|uniref:Inner membrane protein YgaP-like transmembrane domain-containing protein n=1 Tax=Candidatus Syntrophocurvum alkaliphilum TaxID=2293317 RepID=A0A6I6DLJ0_9FIRM|nr:YgaP-like transmembrane domain [Candidatus Syntrophocurvum alkaliphilum]QGU00680.1 hypothetical protein SYNTR_2086 [Candidatus Syntrophocurvum alkaliphilum]
MKLEFERNLATWDRGLRLILAAILFVIPTIAVVGPTLTTILYVLAIINIVEAVIGY